MTSNSQSFYEWTNLLIASNVGLHLAIQLAKYN